MRTPRRHRLTRRQSEHLLDGLEGSSGLAGLLADARPLRANGELPGEATALAAFRSAAVEHLDTRPRSSCGRTLSSRRSLAAKVLAVTVASVAAGGVAMAATGNLPGPLKVVPAESGTARPTGKPSVVDSGKTADTVPRTGDRTRPTGSPTAQPGHREDPAQAIGLCHAWSEVTKNDASALTRSTRFQELVDKAGGAGKVTSFCDEQTRTWCEGHQWPGPTPMQVDGRSVVMRCVRPTGAPSADPGQANSGGRPGPGKNTLPPTHPSGQGSGRAAPLPTGAPVHN